MKLTEEEYRALEPYERNMRTALCSGYASNPGRRALEMMQEIYNRAANVKLRINTGCSQCILRLLKDCANIWFSDKEERMQAESVREKAAEKPAESAETARIPRVAVERIKDMKSRKKVPVKTKTPR